ncbi:MAG: ATP-binding protein, partial [Akkermansiaceae bacterium]|nr:ATP-binding protein [Akkermansiaceae bacterium]
QMADKDLRFPRPMRRAVEEALADTPVVAVLGPRQVGKSTLVRELAPNRPFFDLDESAFGVTAAADPAGFVDGLPPVVTLDEVQRVPELMRAIKVAVDRDRRPGRFLLTGSANLLLLPQLSDSLAGRMEVVHLQPLTEAEKERTGGRFLETFLTGGLGPDIQPAAASTTGDLVRRLLQGGFPEACTRTPSRARVWHRQYLQAVLERDVRDVAKVRDIHDLRRLLELLASQSASLLNTSNVSRDLGFARATVDHYLEVLERLFLIRVLPAWHRTTAKRLVKAPKLHLPDTGLAATLTDLQAEDWNGKRGSFGRLLESMVVQQLVAQAGWTDPAIRFWHYRDKDQVEVDCVVSRGSRIWGVEVKASQTVAAADTKGLSRLAEQSGNDFAGGIVFYSGTSILPLGNGPFLAVPISKLWEL